MLPLLIKIVRWSPYIKEGVKIVKAAIAKRKLKKQKMTMNKDIEAHIDYMQTEHIQLRQDAPEEDMELCFTNFRNGFLKGMEYQEEQAMSQYALQKQGGVDIDKLADRIESLRLGCKNGLLMFDYDKWIAELKTILTTCQATNAQEGVKLPGDEEIEKAVKTFRNCVTLLLPSTEGYEKGVTEFHEGIKWFMNKLTTTPQQLKPLYSITDEDAIEVAKMCVGEEFDWVIEDRKDNYVYLHTKNRKWGLWVWFDGGFISLEDIHHEDTNIGVEIVSIIDYLRSKNYNLNHKQ